VFMRVILRGYVSLLLGETVELGKRLRLLTGVRRGLLLVLRRLFMRTIFVRLKN